MTQKQKTNDSIAQNRKARHDFSFDDRFEAGIALEGWEVKSIRAGRIQLDQSYVLLKDGQAYLFGCHITPLLTASTHITPDPMRNRKLLMHRKELDKLIGNVERKGYTLVPLSLYWKNNKVKLQVALAKGKKDHDKRADEKERDWAREKGRVMKSNLR
jgi:SsrA-binding protein